LQAWSAVFTNVITIIALATLPLWLVSWRQHRLRVVRSETTLKPPATTL
jgi:hypothetical protein